MRIGITGGAGYIGSHVIADLMEAGHEIIVLDNMSLGNPINIFPASPSYHFIQGDIENGEDLQRFFEYRPQAVYHFAASKAAGESMSDPVTYSRNNIRAAFFLIENAIQNSCRYFIFSSSAAVYGSPERLPLDESHRLEPENYYGFTKLTIENNLMWFSRLKGLRFAALRYFNAAGYDLRARVRGLENKPANLLPIIMEAAMGIRSEVEIFGTDYDTPDGTCIRDYVHVNDLASAHILSMQYLMEHDKDLILNIGSESGISVRKMLETSNEITGRKIPYREGPRRMGDPAQLWASSSLAHELIGWRACHSDAETLIRTTWETYLANEKNGGS